MQRKISFAIGEFYHVYNRGTDKRIIFVEDSDYTRFLSLLYLCNSNFPVNIREQFPKGLSFVDLARFQKGIEIVDICAYCLMPNHFHLLLKEKEENGITNFLTKLSTGYSMYFNKKYQRTGKLFENVYKATHIENDEYLKYLVSYIHLNPIKIIDPAWKENGIGDKMMAKKFLKEYTPSSYRDYLDEERLEHIILNKHALPDYFNQLKEFEDFVDFWLDPKGKTFGDR